MLRETETGKETAGDGAATRRGTRLAWFVAGSLGLAVVGAAAAQAQRWGGDGYGQDRWSQDREGPGMRERGDRGGREHGWRHERHGPREMHRGAWREKRMERMHRFCARDTERYQPAMRLFIKADLNLNKDQGQAFDNLADTVLPAMNDIKKTMCSNVDAPKGTPPEMLQRKATLLRKMADAAEKAVDPANKFYATLDDAQKARVEQVLARRGHGMARMMMGGMGGGMHGPMGGPMHGPMGGPGGWHDGGGHPGPAAPGHDAPAPDGGSQEKL